MKEMLKKGDPIPNLTLTDQNGNEVALSSYKGQNLVIYFYPKDNTRICTAQACGFRDHYQDFKDAGAEVIGISTDSPQSHRQVANRRKLPFILLSDPHKLALKNFRIPSSVFGLLPGRVTFIVDKHGIIEHTFRADFQANAHIKEALNVLKHL